MEEEVLPLEEGLVIKDDKYVDMSDLDVLLKQQLVYDRSMKYAGSLLSQTIP